MLEKTESFVAEVAQMYNCSPSKVFRELHREMGHLGVERVLHLTRELFFWPFMKRDNAHFVTHLQLPEAKTSC